ncbi:hypothetical protein [uncultured Ruminococcus sp.]|uniref:hypothetical protein n=1 Tax=uncultured Ruminococcus sp. TaxID=165186 RepID=UPI0025FF4B4B|nr:hypothetical protein [uncultured Ruminococcus sp.]
MDYSEAEYGGTTPQMQLHKVSLNILQDTDSDTIFNVIIMEKDKEEENGKQ